LILDMESSVSETYGEQEGSAYNGHFGCTCCHPLFLLNQFGLSDNENSRFRMPVYNGLAKRGRPALRASRDAPRSIDRHPF
jgi:hypothetical protein